MDYILIIDNESMYLLNIVSKSWITVNIQKIYE